MAASNDLFNFLLSILNQRGDGTGQSGQVNASRGYDQMRQQQGLPPQGRDIPLPHDYALPSEHKAYDPVTEEMRRRILAGDASIETKNAIMQILAERGR